jgi:hypothetical protein
MVKIPQARLSPSTTSIEPEARWRHKTAATGDTSHRNPIRNEYTKREEENESNGIGAISGQRLQDIQLDSQQ